MHQKLRMQIYLANELGYFAFINGKKEESNPEQKYMAIERHIDELGRMIGAWIKKEKAEGNL